MICRWCGGLRRAADQPEPIHAAARGPLLGHLGTESGRKVNRSGARGEGTGQRFSWPGAT